MIKSDIKKVQINVRGKCYKTPFVHHPSLDKAWSFFRFTWEYKHVHVQFESKKKLALQERLKNNHREKTFLENVSKVSRDERM